jgi:hypothetical protein
MNNPPAFPIVGQWGVTEQGMTMRDYFAAKAMQGAMSGCAARGEAFMYSDVAALSYEMADAMLKAREA